MNRSSKLASAFTAVLHPRAKSWTTRRFTCGSSSGSSHIGRRAMSPLLTSENNHCFAGVGSLYNNEIIMTTRSIPRKISTTQIFMSADDDDEDDEKTNESEWNIAELKKETTRLALRCHKKITKASTRYNKAMELVEELTTNPDATVEELEKCPDIESMERDRDALRERLGKLNELETLLAEGLGGRKKGRMVLPSHIAELAMELEVNDFPPVRKPSVKKVKKTQPGNLNLPRVPYRRYYTLDNTEIRVGKQAEDNDELSLSPKHRDGSDWWMHASGCPGSHVVIRCGDAQLNGDVVKDAAALAARQSKCTGKVIKVSLTRCRDVTKPPGAKAGLVQLRGTIKTLSVNMKEAEKRLARLDDTVLVN